MRRPCDLVAMLVPGLVVCGLVAWAHADEPSSSATQPAEHEPTAVVDTSASSGSDDEANGRVASWWDINAAMRGWDDAKGTLSTKGLTLEIGYTNIWQNNARGGLDTNNACGYTGSYDVILQLDTEKAGLWKGGLFNVYMEGSFGRGISERKVGDLLGVNADFYTENDFQVSTAWYQHKFLDEKILVLVGKQDPTSDFDTNRYANSEVTQFLNNAFVNNAAVPWPDYALGVQAAVIPADWFYTQVGLFDAEGRGGRTGFDTAFHGPSHFFLIHETGLTPTFTWGQKKHPGTYRLGYWYDPTPKETFLPLARTGQPEVRSGDWGAYVSVDQRVYKENRDEEDEQGLGVFFRYGYAHGQVNTIENFYSYGLSYTGLVPGRDEDEAALGIAHASLSEALGHVQPGAERETVIEGFYNIHINKYLQLTPDVQFIVNPGGSEDLRNAIVVGMRLAAYF